MEGMDMSGMASNNLSVAVMTNSSSAFSMASSSSSSSSQQCSPMLDGFQFTFGSITGSSSSCILYLFPGANVDTPFKYAVAVVGTCLAAICYELLRARREQLVAAFKPTTTSSSNNSSTFQYTQQQSQQTAAFQSSCDHDFLIAVLYTIQAMLGYFLMMLVMTFDITLFIGISSGLGMGYYWVLRSQRAMAMRLESVANYKLMSSPTAGLPSTTNGFATTPSPTLTSAEAC